MPQYFTACLTSRAEKALRRIFIVWNSQLIGLDFTEKSL